MKHGYRNTKVRNKLEAKVRDLLILQSGAALYEPDELGYTIPASEHIYTPDFRIAPNIYIESKGIWDIEDRKKMLLIQDQYPEVIVCMVFYNSTYKIYPRSKTTYADWCNEHMIPWHDIREGTLPIEWFDQERA